jgi:hypothetical protein
MAGLEVSGGNKAGEGGTVTGARARLRARVWLVEGGQSVGLGAGAGSGMGGPDLGGRDEEEEGPLSGERTSEGEDTVA